VHDLRPTVRRLILLRHQLKKKNRKTSKVTSSTSFNQYFNLNCLLGNEGDRTPYKTVPIRGKEASNASFTGVVDQETLERSTMGIQASTSNGITHY